MAEIGTAIEEEETEKPASAEWEVAIVEEIVIEIVEVEMEAEISTAAVGEEDLSGPKTGYRTSVDNISSRTWQDLERFFRKIRRHHHERPLAAQRGGHRRVQWNVEASGKAMDDNGNLEAGRKTFWTLIEEERREPEPAVGSGGRGGAGQGSGQWRRLEAAVEAEEEEGITTPRSRSGTRSDRD